MLISNFGVSLIHSTAPHLVIAVADAYDDMAIMATSRRLLSDDAYGNPEKLATSRRLLHLGSARRRPKKIFTLPFTRQTLV